jgi:predicted ester cyclase
MGVVADRPVARRRVSLRVGALLCDRDARGWAHGHAPTGKRVDVQLIDIIRFGDDGLAHEHWGVFGMMAMMQQLGAVPGEPSP